MKTENKKSNQTCFQNSIFFKMKTIFKKWKQEMKTKNENANQTHPNIFQFHSLIMSIYKYSNNDGVQD